ncbi:MAG: hypothetical protein IKN73_00535 [Alphaproteobacteria bacterium]|nr:hypothetical protein [Alphaproteobacteria bacterium]
MKGIKSFCSAGLITVFVVGLGYLIGTNTGFFGLLKRDVVSGVENTEYGNFLAAQHALFVNDFESASEMISNVKSDISVVSQTKVLADFFSGKMPENATVLKSDKDLANRLIYDSYLINQNKWSELYQRHAKDNSLMIAPIKIFSAVKQGKTKEALKYVDSLKTTDNWKAFIRGQIAVLNKDVEGAAKEFAKVHPDFMNINDYLYLMSFYKTNDMFEDMDILRGDFTSKPGGMFVLDYDDIPDWSEYSGFENNIAFSMIQTVSHTHIMLLTDLSLLLLRFSESISDTNTDALNYYLGQYYFYNTGDYTKNINNISKNSPFYLFGQMKVAEKNGDLKYIEKIAKNNPLFVPAVDVMLANYIKNGNKRAALNLINSGLKNKDLSDYGKIYFLKQRANVYLMFNNPDKAQSDIYEFMDIDDTLSPDVILLQARAWNQKNINLDDAYAYTMSLIKKNTSDVVAWDLLGVIVDKKEGVDSALELMEHVGGVSVNVSSLYEHLGDLYLKKGENEKAKKSYLRAIDLSDDGLVVVPFVQRKLRKIK